MSQFCIHISDEQHRHQWGYSPTVGTYTCMKCSERRNYNDPQYAEAEREYQAQVRNMQQSSDMVELGARALCWSDDCESGACQNAGRCMAENLNETFYFDANTILRACHHAELVEFVHRASRGSGQIAIVADELLAKIDGRVPMPTIDQDGGELMESWLYLHKWIERGLFCSHTDAKTALEAVAYHPTAPWNNGRWDVDHKPYAEAFYAKFPKARAPAQPENDQCQD